jgi:hypothetical protein
MDLTMGIAGEDPEKYGYMPPGCPTGASLLLSKP